MDTRNKNVWYVYISDKGAHTVYKSSPSPAAVFFVCGDEKAKISPELCVYLNDGIVPDWFNSIRQTSTYNITVDAFDDMYINIVVIGFVDNKELSLMTKNAMSLLFKGKLNEPIS